MSRAANVVKSAALALSIALFGIAPRLHAEPLSEPRSEPYYVWHGVGTGLALGAAAVISVTAPDLPGPDWAVGGWDRSARANFSASAAQRSDQLVTLVVTLPLAIQMSDGFDTALGNASLIYAEAQAANLLLNSITKVAVGRPRPYTHATDERIREFADEEGPDAFASFYSGHSSTAHTAAMAGSILYSMRTDDLVARHVVWGLEFGLAGITAQLRVRAGRHYPSDIWTGALIGAGLGLAVPALHGVELDRVEGTEALVGAGASAVTLGLSELVDFCALFEHLRLCSTTRDVKLPVTPTGGSQARGLNYAVLPVAFQSGAGVQVLGDF